MLAECVNCVCIYWFTSSRKGYNGMLPTVSPRRYNPPTNVPRTSTHGFSLAVITDGREAATMTSRLLIMMALKVYKENYCLSVVNVGSTLSIYLGMYV